MGSGLIIPPGPGPLPGVSTLAGLSDVTPRTLWTPTVTCTTLGDLSVSYAQQQGWYIKVGTLYFWALNLSFTPTYTTATGNFQISGFPAQPTTAGSTGLGTVGQLGSPPAWPNTSNQVNFQFSLANILLIGNKPGSNISIFQITNFTSGIGALIGGCGFFF